MPSAVDTNVLVRFLVDDGSDHVAAARKVFDAGSVLVTASVMLESEWVLRSAFGYPRKAICDAFERVLGLETVVVQEFDVVADAVAAYRSGMDFADALHLYAAGDCKCFYTFDAALIRRASRTKDVIPVRTP